MLAGERQCARKPHKQQPWSPMQRETVRTFSYWKQKMIMERKKCFQWDHLNQLQRMTEISNHDHLITDPAFILIQL